MEHGRRFVRRGESCLQPCLRAAFAFNSPFTSEGANATHDHLDKLLAAGCNLIDLALSGREARSVLHAEPIHLAHELVAELLEEILAE
jgi:hypothetical protein